MNYTISTRRCAGSPYTVWSVRYRGAVIYSCLSPIGDVEAKERIRAHLNPPAVVPWELKDRSRGKPGPKVRGWKDLHAMRGEE